MSGVVLSKIVKSYGAMRVVHGIGLQVSPQEFVVLADRIEQIGTPMDLFNNPANTFVAGFIGSPTMNQFEATVEAGDAGPIAVAQGARIDLPPLDGLRDAADRKVIVGNKPEHASIKPIGEGSKVAVELGLIETLGSEALLHTRVGDAPFVIKAETGGDTERLSGVNAFHVASSRIKVFDHETGRVLSAPEMRAAA